MQSLLRSFHDDDDSSSAVYSEPKGNLGRGLLDGDSSTSSYYQSRGHTRMIWVGGLLVCLAMVPLVLWPSKHDSLSITAVADDLSAQPVQTANRFRPEVGDDDFKFTNMDADVQEHQVVGELALTDETNGPEQIEPTTKVATTLVPVDLVPIVTSLDEIPTVPTLTTIPIIDGEGSTSGIGAPHRKPITFPPQCSDADQQALLANDPVSEACRTAYKLLALEEGGKALISRRETSVLLPLDGYPSECTVDEIAAVETAAGDIHSALVTPECARAYTAAREAQLHLHLHALEEEVTQIRDELAQSTDP